MATNGALTIEKWIKCIQDGELLRLKNEVGESLKEGKSPIIDEAGRNILHWAASLGSYESVEWLLQNDLNVNAQDDSLWTPLIIASSAGHEKILRLLLSFGAEVNTVTDQGRTAFFYAVSRNRVSIVRLLIESKANVNLQDKFGASPLHRLAGVGHIEMMNLYTDILSKEVKPDLRDKEGNTALHVAIDAGSLSLIEGLLKLGCDPSILNKEEMKPIDLAPVNEKKKLQTIFDRYINP
eukprot:TRINITY_DN2559_c0_g1_i1.p1 TRINITY_DN2559_c0_g1~~TRINITY_DN2559_c0_g1_i1.p1  ORF type:complete len:238 (-),score=34.40 TRINITY_DN2559_c0_g1_i1:36-749(-)